MNLEWKTKLMFKMMKLAGNKPLHEMAIEDVRAQEMMEDGMISNLFFGKTASLPKVEDIEINGRSHTMPARVYYPVVGEKRPFLLYYHGGGFAVGNVETHDKLCRRLAKDSGRIVVSVDYRLAPEHRFPAGIEDAADALVWLAEMGHTLGGDVSDIAVGGDSAGGNFAAVVSQKARNDKGPAISKQLLIYPAVDMSKTYPSAERFSNNPILSKKDMDWFAEMYLDDEAQTKDPTCSPLLGDLHNLPPAFILTAEYDPLLDQGNAYAKALKENGNAVTIKEYPRQLHGFMTFAGVSGQADQAFKDAAAFLR